MHKVLHCQNTITTSCGYERPPRVSGEIDIKGVADETGPPAIHVATTALGGVPILRV
jgi:hypothetical protein